jgi:hypothetical protein
MRLKWVWMLVLCCCASLNPLKAQPGKESNPYILFTGLVLTSDSLKPIPFVNIRTPKRGLIGFTDYLGHFDVVVRKGDTILFQQVEQEPSWHVVPDTLMGNRSSIIKLMTQDTIQMSAIFIRALPLKSLFEKEFVSKDIPDDAYERARQNLEAEALKEEQRLRPADPNMSQQLLAQSRANQLYYYKQAPPQNYFSPGAWVQFLEAWKRGDFKKKPQKKSTYVSPY